MANSPRVPDRPPMTITMSLLRMFTSSRPMRPRPVKIRTSYSRYGDPSTSTCSRNVAAGEIPTTWPSISRAPRTASCGSPGQAPVSRQHPRSATARPSLRQSEASAGAAGSIADPITPTRICTPVNGSRLTPPCVIGCPCAGRVAFRVTRRACIQSTRPIPARASPEIPLLRLELVLVDLAARVALAQDVQGRIRPRLAALHGKPAETEHDSDDDQDPEDEHEQHHAEPPGSPHAPHRMPSPFPRPLLGPARGRQAEHGHQGEPRRYPSHGSVLLALRYRGAYCSGACSNVALQLGEQK